MTQLGLTIFAISMLLASIWFVALVIKREMALRKLKAAIKEAGEPKNEK